MIHCASKVRPPSLSYREGRWCQGRFQQSGDSNVIWLFVPTKEERVLSVSWVRVLVLLHALRVVRFVVTINMDASVRPPKFQQKSCFRVFVGLPFPNDSTPKQSPVHHLG